MGHENSPERGGWDVAAPPTHTNGLQQQLKPSCDAFPHHSRTMYEISYTLERVGVGFVGDNRFTLPIKQPILNYHEPASTRQGITCLSGTKYQTLFLALVRSSDAMTPFTSAIPHKPFQPVARPVGHGLHFRQQPGLLPDAGTHNCLP